MTREKVKELLPVMQAYANGEVIQFCHKTPEPHWVDVQSDDLIEFREDASRYRIKPEPKYRPFKNAEECFNEMQKHQPIGWLYWNNVFVHITEIGLGCIAFDNCKYSFVEAFNHGYTFADGQPFGIKEH